MTISTAKSRRPSRKHVSITLFATRIEAHWSCLFLAPYIVWQICCAGAWGAATTITIVALVLLHELGHTIACRRVKGRVDKIVLWPFGGLAHVTPPNRAGGVFWTVFGGPLANIMLLVPLYGLAYFTNRVRWAGWLPTNRWAREAFAIDFLILAFNLLPVYPLDGARLVQTLLWKYVGRWHAAEVSGLVGLASAGAGIVAGVVTKNPILIGLGLAGAAFSGWEQRRARQVAKSLRTLRKEFACPDCRSSPAVGNFWQCSCGTRFDALAHGATCPCCHKEHPTTTCLACGKSHPISDWRVLSRAA